MNQIRFEKREIKAKDRVKTYICAETYIDDQSFLTLYGKKGFQHQKAQKLYDQINGKSREYPELIAVLTSACFEDAYACISVKMKQTEDMVIWILDESSISFTFDKKAFWHEVKKLRDMDYKELKLE